MNICLRSLLAVMLLCILSSCQNKEQEKHFPINEVLAKASQLYTVSPTMETVAVSAGDDTADDPCIFIHPNDPSLSTIIGTNKNKQKGGLHVYDVNGKEIQFVQDGAMNNVDIRYDFSFGKEKTPIVVAGNRSNNSFAIYKVDIKTRKLDRIPSTAKNLGMNVYGSCLYRSKKDGNFYVFANDKDGQIKQWQLFESKGKVDIKHVRTMKVPTQTEGCVADDALGHLYVGEEVIGIWKFGADPDAGVQGKLIDKIGKNITADVEGLTIYYADEKTGYLIASSQGNNTYAVYEREGDNKYLGRFEIASGNGFGGTSDTDGIDVASVPFGNKFKRGMFVAQDGFNDGKNQNFKCVPWENIANKFNPPLIVK
ncbi:phytase [bacterium]|jgi:3-phytase|nr:phytase [bacterium]